VLPTLDQSARLRHISLDLHRLDGLLEVFYKRAIEKADCQAGLCVVKILERKAALLGLDQPTKLDIVQVQAQAQEAPQGHDRILPQLETEIVKRSDRTKGFVVLPRRWVVERTFAWLNRCRRLGKDWENLNRNALTFLRLASIRLMHRKLCNPA